MMRFVVILLAGLFALDAAARTEQPVTTDACVVLLHGLVRTDRSMRKLEEALADDGYRIANIGYASRSDTIVNLAELAVTEGIEDCGEVDDLHFVTHSLGGILIRAYTAQNELPQLKRVVMLGPPNQGSHIVDKWRSVPGYTLVQGPAGRELGTGADSVPRSLGPVSFELGVIAGTSAANPFLALFLPRPNDGKVTVDNTKVDGMVDFVALPVTHTFMMRDDEVIRQVRAFLKRGRFES